MAWIIVKYADMNYPNGKAPLWAAAHPNTYTARECGIVAHSYGLKESAEKDLEKMQEFNPSVGYGICEVGK